MTDIAAAPEPKPRAEKRTIYRHRLIVRITHWVNAVCILFLLMSGLQIFNAHPHLYWGEASTFDAQNRPINTVLSIGTVTYQDGRREGFIQFFGGDFITTTGFLGLSQNTGDLWTTVGNDLRDWIERTGLIEENEEVVGDLAPIAIPSWLTLPSWQDLAAGRLWHFLFAWIFVINLAVYVTYGLAGRHFWRDLVPSRDQWRSFGRTVWDHVRFRFPHGEEAVRYNILQKLAYIVAVLALVVMVLTGLSMSPGINAAAPWLTDIFGGRQSARTFHFISATIIVLFAVVHIILVLVSGVWNNLRSMITGRYVIKPERRKE